ncbi:MAG: hypothetical protein JXR68_06325 [Bacteroidales bacterium]|nr:hypothetical protein [Bacteroidales bacterium]
MLSKMDSIGFLVIGFYALGFIAVLSIIIVLIVKRVKDKEKENFEQRDN